MMVEIKASKSKDGLLLSGSMPVDLSAASALELFALKDGIYLLAIKGAIDNAGKPSKMQPIPTVATGALLSEKEKEVVRKLLSVRFDRRMPAEIAKLLSKEEKETLEGLMKRKLVHIFHGGKYEKEGVYNVSDFAFNSVREPSAPSQHAPLQQPLPINSAEHLEKNGWMVLENETDAKNFASAYPEKVKSGDVKGTRAFDRKYYFVKRGYYEAWEKEVQLSLAKSEKTAEEIAAELSMAPEGARCLLLHMCETGDILERHKGKFARA